MFITVQDFTGVYAEQPFMRELREKSAKSADIHWLDCTKIVGTDCYCDDDAVKAINEMIENAESGCVSENRGNSGNVPTIHFFDNGNYHYMSKLWTDRIQHPFTLIVFDHHPDMQPPRFGGILSCGGWVLEVLENNKFVQNVIIIGVKDELVETVREELSQSGKVDVLDNVTFIRESELTSVTPKKPSPDRATLSSFVNQRSGLSSNIYLSIDKDSLAPAFAATNWDQGSLSVESLKNYITSFTANRKILGIDICGERAHDFEGDANHTVQKADSLNNSLNRELVDFLQKL